MRLVRALQGTETNKYRRPFAVIQRAYSGFRALLGTKSLMWRGYRSLN